MAVDKREWAGSLYSSVGSVFLTSAQLRKDSIVGELAHWPERHEGLAVQPLCDRGLEMACKGRRCTALPVVPEKRLVPDMSARSLTLSDRRLLASELDLRPASCTPALEGIQQSGGTVGGFLLPERAH